jgi:exodeoxyribonuclease VII large subunit
MMLESTPENPIYTVSQLNQEVRTLLEYALPFVLLEGEISNLRAPGSGHLYFSLKDAQAQVRCALFRTRFAKPGMPPIALKEGMHVLVRAEVSLYEERGDFQLIVSQIEEIGEGALRRAFEALKKQLAAEGLFETAHKKALPKWPTCVGVITSPTGAAVRDILSVLQRRFPGLPVIIYPTLVQGAQAASQITAALQIANARAECDVLILARGGGSLEDLWPFNEVEVARAIYASHLPIVTGIGHEIDFTIADFVADQRAATPSAAAELISPHTEEWIETTARTRTRLIQAIQHILQEKAVLLQHLEKRLPHPQRRLEDQMQKLDALTQRLCLAQKNILQRTHEKLSYVMRALDAISPLNTLKRGYAIAFKDGKILQDAADAVGGDTIQVKLAKGELQCKVDSP